MTLYNSIIHLCTAKNGRVISTSGRLLQLQFCKLVSLACPNTVAIYMHGSSCNILRVKHSFVVAYPCYCIILSIYYCISRVQQSVIAYLFVIAYPLTIACLECNNLLFHIYLLLHIHLLLRIQSATIICYGILTQEKGWKPTFMYHWIELIALGNIHELLH